MWSATAVLGALAQLKNFNLCQSEPSLDSTWLRQVAKREIGEREREGESRQPITMLGHKTNLNEKHQVDKYRLCLCRQNSVSLFLCLSLSVICIWYSKTVRLCGLTHICLAHTHTLTGCRQATAQESYKCIC